MKCPFRIDLEYEYVQLISGKDDKEDSYLEKAQRQRYPECEGDECPFYAYGACERVNLLLNDE